MKIKWHTENPPLVEEEYLVTSTSGNLYIAEWTDTGYFGGHKLRTDWRWVSDNMYMKVAAWMPLPEPYKEPIEVVNCKDCEYGENDDPDNPNQYLCTHNGSDWNNGSHFCSYGKKK